MFVLTIATDGSAFDGMPYAETARILRRLADDLEGIMPEGGRLFDVNGNVCGGFSFTGIEVDRT